MHPALLDDLEREVLAADLVEDEEDEAETTRANKFDDSKVFNT